MMENEEDLEVLLTFSEGDGWVKARINYKGEIGYVPPKLPTRSPRR